MQRRLGSLGWGVLAVVTMVGSTGCLVNMMALPFFLLGKEPMVDPPVPLVEGKRDKKKVLVLTFADNGLRFTFDSLEDDLAKLMITELTINEPRLEPVSDRKVRAWRDLNPNWTERSLQEIGEHFDVDYVMYAEVARFSLSETKNQYLLKGKASVLFKIHDVNKDATLFDEVYQREYPPHRSVPLSEVASETRFRQKFEATIARELMWYVIPHRRMDEISDI